MNQRLFAERCRVDSLPWPVFELQFAPPRKWRFDVAWPERLLALEVEGGAWVSGRHNRAGGFLKDMLKYNRAACLGWRLLRCTPQQVESGEVFALLREALLVSDPFGVSNAQD